MATAQGAKPNLDRYVVIHVATTCDEHGVYVTKDSAEVIELGWILLDAKGCQEVDIIPDVSWTATANATTLLICILLLAPPRKRPGQADQHSHYAAM